jgi:hypothetical protein
MSFVFPPATTIGKNSNLQANNIMTRTLGADRIVTEGLIVDGVAVTGGGGALSLDQVLTEGNTANLQSMTHISALAFGQSTVLLSDDYNYKNYNIVIGTSANASNVLPHAGLPIPPDPLLGSYYHSNICIGNAKSHIGNKYNVTVGTSAGFNATYASNNVCFGYYAGFSTAISPVRANNICIGERANKNLTNATANSMISIGQAANSGIGAPGYFSSASLTHSVAIGADSRGVSKSVAIGRLAQAFATRGIAIGPGSKITSVGVNGIAIGSDNGSDATLVDNWGGIAIGVKTKCYGESGVVIGTYANVGSSGDNSIALGYKSKALLGNSVAIGGGNSANLGAYAKGLLSVAIGAGGLSSGKGAYAKSDRAVVIGARSYALAIHSVAIGAYAYTTQARGLSIMGYNKGAGSVTIGYNSYAKSGSTASIAIGKYSLVNDIGSIALGASATSSTKTKSYGSYSIAIGSGGGGINGARTSSTKLDAIAIGRGSSAQETNSIAIGKNAVATGASSDLLAINFGQAAPSKFTTSFEEGAFTMNNGTLPLPANANSSMKIKLNGTVFVIPLFTTP